MQSKTSRSSGHYTRAFLKHSKDMLPFHLLQRCIVNVIPSALPDLG